MSPRGWALFAAVPVVWGMPYLFIKISVDGGIDPAFLAWARCALAALVLLPFALKAFMLFFSLIAEIGPARASVITYINPAVALALGVAVLGEEVTAGVGVGLLAILAGSWLATDGRLPPGLAAMFSRGRPTPA